MSYTVEFKKSAGKALKRFPKSDLRSIQKTIDMMIRALPDQNLTNMKGENPFHRVRVGDYRIIYEIDEENSLIVILKVGHRKDVYKHVE